LERHKFWIKFFRSIPIMILIKLSTHRLWKWKSRKPCPLVFTSSLWELDWLKTSPLYHLVNYFCIYFVFTQFIVLLPYYSTISRVLSGYLLWFRDIWFYFCNFDVERRYFIYWHHCDCHTNCSVTNISWRWKVCIPH